mmetsp:Transcript_113385/g.219616  ORF Transcript_113385/g.219616 Transcript_113385/m.219616 type:complete len:84 (+) Transcript_113385:81-332(+)
MRYVLGLAFLLAATQLRALKVDVHHGECAAMCSRVQLTSTECTQFCGGTATGGAGGAQTCNINNCVSCTAGSKQEEMCNNLSR